MVYSNQEARNVHVYKDVKKNVYFLFKRLKYYLWLLVASAIAIYTHVHVYNVLYKPWKNMYMYNIIVRTYTVKPLY